MKGLDELINRQEPGWDSVQQWLTNATNHVDVLVKDNNLAAQALIDLQVTTRSPLGAVVYETGGMLIDGGWLRILGSGHPELPRNPAVWTRILSQRHALQALLIADDVSGGFFALNGGGLGDDQGGIYYFAPDSLIWESLGVGYSGFLAWAFNGDLDTFYQTVRWHGWREEISSLSGNEVYSFFPFLWTEPTLPVTQRKRSRVSIEEHWTLSHELAQDLNQQQI
ncbi:DUF2625 domain-containing protein [Pantoea phytobeneficialis]|uniref:DUF2625 domain-containing protein n=1 Tax=Pantoea phytobeneficialis TaxID=2052056 RepID=A0AAP9KSA4_9GAMM|nr:DUF2625 domain-containing protein [Pantoea phytobeneficialis]MDO6406929.1 DUF2625 domain-containing protein [Pantoea phytobeneficialis]QGR09895.1 hypothetical protein CTZ24_25875 [Pantoea phytobeneficialis]